MISHDEDLVSLEELQSVLNTYAGPPTPRTRPASHGIRRLRPILVASFALVALVAVMVATPAWALVRDALPFWNQPTAPHSVQLAFASMNLGAPADMNPGAVSGDTRAIEQVTLDGTTHTLWVAPAKNGGSCFLLAGAGGCNPANLPLSYTAMLVPGSASAPARWIAGDVTKPATDVVISFSDGSTIHPQITWVSAPINAGFFAYDVPSGKQTSANHATAIAAYNQDGTLLKRYTL